MFSCKFSRNETQETKSINEGVEFSINFLPPPLPRLRFLKNEAPGAGSWCFFFLTSKCFFLICLEISLGVDKKLLSLGAQLCTMVIMAPWAVPPCWNRSAGSRNPGCPLHWPRGKKQHKFFVILGFAQSVHSRATILSCSQIGSAAISKLKMLNILGDIEFLSVEPTNGVPNGVPRRAQQDV